MVPGLEDDLRNIAEWADAAARHHGNGLPRESLMHGRNIGEAACRVIIRMAWPGRRGEEELRMPQFDLLLRTIQNKALAPPEIISALHVLRTRGNNALHGRPVGSSDSAGALFMLQALLAHLFGTLQQRPLPTSPARAIDQALGGRSEPEHREALRTMLREVLREEVRNEPPTPVAPALDPATVRRLEAEQEEHRARIRDMEQLVREVAARGTEPMAPENNTGSAPVRVRRTAWWVVAAALAVLALVALLITAPWKSGTHAAPLPAPDSTVTTVLILPFALMQDDPNLNLRFEQAMADRLAARIREGGLAMRVFLADTVFGAVPVDDSVLALARRHHADVVFYGELFEPTSADSGRVRIRFISQGEGHWPKGDLGALGFRTLADSGAIRAQRAVQGIAELALAQRLYGSGRVSAALALLYQVPPVNTDWAVTTHLMRARCHRLLKDLGPAMREMEAALALAPDNAGTLAYMGRVLSENGDLTAAVRYYELALAHEPRNARWLMALATLLSDRSRPDLFDSVRVRLLSSKALDADSTYAFAWDLHGQLLAADGEHAAAQAAFERAITLDSTYAMAMYDLAWLLLHHIRPVDEPRAERLLRSALRLDSSDTRVMLLLAQVLTRGADRDPQLADRLYRMAHAADPRQELRALAGRAEAAQLARDHRRALDLYQQLWAKDSSEVAVGVRMAVLLQKLDGLEAAKAMLRRCLALDSMHHAVNLNLGIFHLEPGTAPERRKAIHFLERALITDPKDPVVLERLGMALTEDGRIDRARTVLEQLLRLEPNNHVGNGYLGIIMQQLGRPLDAIRYYEHALTSDPGDPVVCGNLATLYLSQHPQRLNDARALLMNALQGSPDDPFLHMNLHAVAAEEGDFRRAADHYRRAIALKPSLRSASVERKLADHGQW